MAVRTGLIVRFQHLAPDLQLYRRGVAAAAALGLFLILEGPLGFQHFLAQRRGTLGLFLRLPGQLLQLLLLLGRQLVRLGAEELLLELGDRGPRLGQLVLQLAGVFDQLCWSVRKLPL